MSGQNHGRRKVEFIGKFAQNGSKFVFVDTRRSGFNYGIGGNFFTANCFNPKFHTPIIAQNGKKLNETYITVPTCTEQMEGAVTVGEGEVFIMGDNRKPSQSWDSRSFGCVREEDIVGKVCFRLYPFDRFGGI